MKKNKQKIASGQLNESSNMVESSTATTLFRNSKENMFPFERTQLWPKDSVQIDVMGNFWLLITAELEDDHVFYARHGKTTALPSGKICIFLPAFSMMQWHFSGKLLKWRGVSSCAPIPAEISKTPFVFSISAENLHKLNDVNLTYKNILTLLKSANDSTRIGNEQEVLGLSKKIKHRIDTTFTENISLKQMAEENKTSSTIVSRYFKKTYGITPIAYRNKMRIFESLGLLLSTNLLIHDIAAQVGFKDLAQFNLQFKKEISVVPSQFLF